MWLHRPADVFAGSSSTTLPLAKCQGLLEVQEVRDISRALRNVFRQEAEIPEVPPATHKANTKFILTLTLLDGTWPRS